jgi:hypothetical protein
MTKTHEEMLNIPDHKGNANQNQVKIPPYSVRMAVIKTQTTTHTGKDVGKNKSL